MRSRAAIRRPLAILAGAALGLVLLACALVDDALPCWVEVRIDHRARDGAEPVTPTTLADASRLVDARLGAYGVERTVFTRETEELIVGLPEQWATDDVMELIVAPGLAAFVPVPEGQRPPETGDPVPDEAEALFGGEEVSAVRLGENAGLLTLEFQLTERGKRQFGVWSQANFGGHLVIALDQTVLTAPMVAAPILGGQLEVITVQDRRRLEWAASVLSFGPLPIALERTSTQAVDTDKCHRTEPAPPRRSAV